MLPFQLYPAIGEVVLNQSIDLFLHVRDECAQVNECVPGLGPGSVFASVVPMSMVG